MNSILKKMTNTSSFEESLVTCVMLSCSSTLVLSLSRSDSLDCLECFLFSLS